MTTSLQMAWHKGDVLRKARDVAGFSQLELAARLGVDPNTVRRAESGSALIKPERAMAWAAATDVDYKELQWALDKIGQGWAPWDSNPQPAVYVHSSLTCDDLALAA